MPKKQATSQQKPNYKKKFKESEKLIKQLEQKIKEQKKENESNIKAFQNKAKTFQDKAKSEVTKIRQEILKRSNKDISEIKKYAPQELLEAIIDPILNIELAANSKSTSPEVEAYVKGFKMILNQLDKEFESLGVNKIIPKVGEDFNPEIHHAFSTEKGDKNKIIKVKKNGIKFHDRTIRPAVVVIGK